MSHTAFVYPLRQRIHRLLAPRAQGEDERRQEFIAMVLLGGLAIITGLKMLYLVVHPDHLGFDQEEDSLVAGGCFLVIVTGLWYLARRGRYRWSVFGLLGILTAEAVRLTLSWSFELPIAELMYALVIVVAGVLLTIRRALIVSGGVALLLFSVSYFQVAHHLQPRTDWLQQDFQMADAVGYVAILTIIALVCWLTNREINQSLQRARTSEAQLAKERDNLEAQVVRRTHELHQAELKHIMQLQRFAEFGRLSANLLHEVASPLTAASLNLQQFNDDQPQLVLEARKNLQQLERYIAAARKQLKTEGSLNSFSVRRELAQVLSIVRPLARRAGVRLVIKQAGSYKLFGDPVKFSQLVANLLANAIDAYADSPLKHGEKLVTVSLWQESAWLKLRVSDHGKGIEAAQLSHVFEPFYTTKANSGTGIGLTMVKRIVEDDFHGHITLTSSPGSGSTFTIQLRRS